MLSWSVRLRECFATSLTAYLFLCQTSASLEAKRRAMEAVDLRLRSRWLEVRWFSSTRDLAPRQQCKLTRILFCSTFSHSLTDLWCGVTVGGGARLSQAWDVCRRADRFPSRWTAAGDEDVAAQLLLLGDPWELLPRLHPETVRHSCTCIHVCPSAHSLTLGCILPVTTRVVDGAAVS